MIVDTSVLVAIFADEPERPPFEAALDRARKSLISAGSWIEFTAVLVRKFGVADPGPILEDFGKGYGLSVAPVTPEQATVGSAAYARYGRGTGHPARLNFGDCFSYALAKVTGEPLLFKGDDFARTDIIPALPA